MAKRARKGARERRDIVSGEVLAEPKLIRFVAAPDGTIVPDLAAKLPGRGIWVAANRAALETALDKRLFVRGAKRQVTLPVNLVGQVEAGLKKRVLAAIGLANRAGLVVSGFDTVRAAIKAEPPLLRLEATDGSADGRKKISHLAKALYEGVPVVGALSRDELGAVLGVGSCVHALVKTGDGARQLKTELSRWGGFVPLLPSEWTESG